MVAANSMTCQRWRWLRWTWRWRRLHQSQRLTMTTTTAMMMAMKAAAVAANATIKTMKMTMTGGGNVVQQGKDCTILMTMTFWMTFLMMITSRSIFRAFRMSPLAIAIVIESWEDPSLLAQMQPKRRRKATNLNGRHLPTPIVARSWLLCPL